MASNVIFKKSGLLKAMSRRVLAGFTLAAVSGIVGTTAIFAQEPKPGPSRQVVIPAVKETKLKNGLTVAVVERRGVPLVSVRLIVNTGSTSDDEHNAGLAMFTGSLLTKGTTTRSSEEIASTTEFFGSSIYTSIGLDNSTISFSVTKDKLESMLEVFSDVIQKPSFPEKEVTLTKSQFLDELKYNLTQPAFLSNYVASAYSFNDLPAGGTPESLSSIDRTQIQSYYSDSFVPDGSTLLFVGDIDAKKAFALSENYFGNWKNGSPKNNEGFQPEETVIELIQPKESVDREIAEKAAKPLLNRILVLDMPSSGQASVSFVSDSFNHGRIVWNDTTSSGEYSAGYFPATIMNSVLGGGYSSRLNYEIRIKRGLSYGAGSNFTWRAYDSKFQTRTQTKNESAAEVVEIVLQELQKLKKEKVSPAELLSRKAVIIGTYGLSIETNIGVSNVLSELYSDSIPSGEMSKFIERVEAVTGDQILTFTNENFVNGDIIIVGDYAKFKDDLARRFPNIKPEVISAAELDITKPNLRK